MATLTLSCSDMARSKDRGRTKPFVARITGRDSKFTFAREFLAKSVVVDEPGLYQTRNASRYGEAEDTYCVYDGVRSARVSHEDAMSLAKEMPTDWTRAVLESAIKWHEQKIAQSAVKDPEGMVHLTETVGTLSPGSVRRADLIAARQQVVADIRLTLSATSAAG